MHSGAFGCAVMCALGALGRRPCSSVVARCAAGSGFGVCVQWLRLHFTSRTLELSTRTR